MPGYRARRSVKTLQGLLASGVVSEIAEDIRNWLPSASCGVIAPARAGEGGMGAVQSAWLWVPGRQAAQVRIEESVGFIL